MRTYTYKKLIIFEDPANFERTYYLEGMDNDDWLQVINRHNSFRVWTESVAVPDDDDEPSLMDAFDTKLTPYTSTVTLGDYSFPAGSFGVSPLWSQIKQSAKDGDIVAVDPLTGSHATLTNFSKDPNDYPATAADLDASGNHFASEVRALHPTQEDRIEKKLVSLEEMLEEILRQLSTGVTS